MITINLLKLISPLASGALIFLLHKYFSNKPKLIAYYSHINAFKDLLKEIMKTRLRVKYGVKEELLVLLKLENIGRVRARKLYKAGIKDIRAVKKAALPKLINLLGQKTAISVKEQVGQKVKIK